MCDICLSDSGLCWLIWEQAEKRAGSGMHLTEKQTVKDHVSNEGEDGD